MTSSGTFSPLVARDDASARLAESERVVRQLLDQLAQAETEIARLRASAQVVARRGY
jgi:hypothetical protein